MTGVVGPNGCGKSNLVEALRWVMGENSARRMRGGEMEDVIFGGAATRPARNIAEVTLVVEDDGALPPGIARLGGGEIEIVRRIERGHGSDYRVGGRPARARDVQTFFADAASGSQSPALVSQGRVSALINAKPSERRQVLEDAAGISGLHARRHEAEIRLRAAEANLERLDDVFGAMQGRLAALKRQSRQAVRYRELSEELRRAEAVLLAIAWDVLVRREAAARAAFADADALVRQAMLDVAQATARAADCAAALPPLRKEEASRLETLSSVMARRDALAAEERRAADAAAESARQSRQLSADRAHEARQQEEADAVESRLAAEAETLVQQARAHPAEQDAAERALAAIREQVAAAEQERDRLTETVAKTEAEAVALGRQKRDIDQRLATLERRLVEETRRLQSMPPDHADAEAIAAAASRLAAAEQDVVRARDDLAASEAARVEAEAAVAAARVLERQASGEANRLAAERKGLAGLLKAGGATGDFAAVLDVVRAAQGYEIALAAALADGLEAALDPRAPIYWRPPDSQAAPASLPEEAEKLSPRIDAPPHLAAALAHVGLVADDRTGDRLARDLAPGQSLVSRAGAVWRWDGLTRRKGAASAAALRLEQRNRLDQVERELAGAEQAARRAAEALADADKVLAGRAAAGTQARAAVMNAAAALERSRGEHAQRTREAEARSVARRSLTQSVALAEADRAAAAADQAAFQASLAALPDASQSRRRLDQVRASLAADRNRLALGQSTLERLGREEATRNHRLAAIARERQEWRDRAARAAARLAEIEARAEEARLTQDRLAAEPARLAAARQSILFELDDAETARRAAADRLATAESAQLAADRVLRQMEAALAEARETRIRAEAAVGSAMEELQQLRGRAVERLGDGAPDTIDLRVLAHLAGLSPENLPEPAAAETRRAKLLRDREAIGPVNLRAEIEVAEIEGEIARMTAERDDLLAAIARLRHAVNGLNREARERLMASFGTIDMHFRTLFVQLFGGGSAELKLTDSDDPLDAGLEIMASPPGKKLQQLSLLSGGEQALTAIALIFAMFLTNPSPVCVLDEVDAPLDDANVDRFCLLVQKIAESCRTRFLIITHHRLTMSRMDRLYGVTMAEQGVSQLVSVDLRGADALSAAE